MVKIKGITVEIDGNVTGLDEVLLLSGKCSMLWEHCL